MAAKTYLKKTDDNTPTLEKIRAKESQFSKLYSRMDSDRDAVYLNKYELKDTRKVKVDGAVSVTMNDAAVYANAIANSLMTSKWQAQIETKSKETDFDTYIPEQFVADTELDANERLIARGEPDLFSWLCNHVCVRSYIGVRFMFLMDDEGNLIPHYLPVDMRYTPYGYSTNGIAWAAPKFWLSEDEIAADYPNLTFTARGTDIELIDYWDAEKNEIYIGGQLIQTNPNPIGYAPFVISRPATGFMLRDKGYLEHEAESIFFLNRSLYDEWNRTVSIEQTMNMKLIMPPYQKMTQDFSSDPAAYPDAVGKVNEVLPGEEYKLLETKDVNAAHRLASNALSGALANGGANGVDLGNVGMQVSAVWITEQSEIRAKILEPRLRCLANFRSALARMKIDQYIKGAYTASIGKNGAKSAYDFKELGDPKSYTITYSLKSKSKKMEVANFTIAQAARGIVSQETILKDIIEIDDFNGEIERLNIEKAEQGDPILFYMRRAFEVLQRAEKIEGLNGDILAMEGMILTQKIINLIMSEKVQANQGSLYAKDAAGKGGSSNSLLPLLQQPISNSSAPQTTNAGGG